MPEYDPVNYPRPMSDDLTHAEVGRDTTGQQPKTWPSSNLVPEEYAGPVPSREFETSGLGRAPRDRPVAAGPQPPDAPAPEQSIVPPPGHTAQP